MHAQVHRCCLLYTTKQTNRWHTHTVKTTQRAATAKQCSDHNTKTTKTQSFEHNCACIRRTRHSRRCRPQTARTHSTTHARSHDRPFIRYEHNIYASIRVVISSACRRMRFEYDDVDCVRHGARLCSMLSARSEHCVRSISASAVCVCVCKFLIACT